MAPPSSRRTITVEDDLDDSPKPAAPIDRPTHSTAGTTTTLHPDVAYSNCRPCLNRGWSAVDVIPVRMRPAANRRSREHGSRAYPCSGATALTHLTAIPGC